jgi:hypothetical protein
MEAPDLLEHGVRSKDRDPSCQARVVRSVTQRLSVRFTNNLVPLRLDTLAEGTPVRMYRQLVWLFRVPFCRVPTNYKRKERLTK